jgi:capsule polysaccharide export protein KpsE/RkpR
MVMEQTIEQRLTDLERRFYPIESVLYNMFEKEIESVKSKEIEDKGDTYKVSFTIETDVVTKEVNFEVKAFSEKQALFIGNRDYVFPQMSRLKDNGKIKWFKTINKKIL